jgi:ABC-type multidrug transport system ATPase subunit
MIGYCPQFDALFDNLSVWEHLKFYATIKGIDPSVEEKLIRQQIEAFDLLKFRDTVASKLSGGTKRKLSCAIALIGNPPLILLDEPSTGVDPLAKRHMW